MIDIKALSFQYRGQLPLFTDLNLSLAPNHVYGLLGKNGAGKTTLLKLISGLVFPTTGTCRVWDKAPCERRAEFLQDIYFLADDVGVPPLTMAEYCNLYAPFYPRFDAQHFQNALRELDLPHTAHLQQLSTGQKKKFLLAFGLASGARLLLFDEPTNGLDIPSKAQFRKLVVTHADLGKTFVISTHQVHDVELLVDAIVLLDAGKILLNASMANIANHVQVELHQTQPAQGSCLYYEKTLQGFRVVTRAHAATETALDLEILFNAVLANRDHFTALFADISGENHVDV
jgi:ABC-2 type transport system ATP-binding protein